MQRNKRCEMKGSLNPPKSNRPSVGATGKIDYVIDEPPRAIFSDSTLHTTVMVS